MRVIVLEDDQRRVEIFKERLEGDDVEMFFTEDVDECIKALKDQDWDYLFLDHDLGGKQYVESDGDELTGFHVAKWLRDNPERKPPTIFIHSLNEYGRKNMLSMIPDAHEHPGIWMNISWA